MIRVEHHMSTAVSVHGDELDDEVCDRFFARVAALEDVLSRFRPGSDISRLARGEVGLDDVDPAVRLVLAECERLRDLTGGDFDHEPGGRLDTDAVAKGWIVEDAAMALRLHGGGMLVDAGGDVVAAARRDGRPWRVGVQHPSVRDAIVGTMVLRAGAVATSGTYERGDHLRVRDGGDGLVSVTVAGPDLAHADGLSTAVFAGGRVEPRWWGDVDDAYGLLTMTGEGRLRWVAPRDASATAVEWCPATTSRPAAGTAACAPR